MYRYISTLHEDNNNCCMTCTGTNWISNLSFDYFVKWIAPCNVYALGSNLHSVHMQYYLNIGHA